MDTTLCPKSYWIEFSYLMKSLLVSIHYYSLLFITTSVVYNLGVFYLLLKSYKINYFWFLSRIFKDKISRYSQIIYYRRALKAFNKTLQSSAKFHQLSTSLYLAPTFAHYLSNSLNQSNPKSFLYYWKKKIFLYSLKIII